MSARPRPHAPVGKPRVALVLQGGGALGAYQVGAYQALAEADLHPDWIAGISIGAINAAVMAGNPPGNRVERLDALWRAISWPELAPTGGIAPLQRLFNWASEAEAYLIGQPNFFVPRAVNPWLLPHAPPEELSFYDTAPMLATLRDFADFGLVNHGPVRLSLGATNLLSGSQEYFDTTRGALGPAHVLACCSLPPGFPATVIDGTPYWDGGCVSNTPLDAIVAEPIEVPTVAFVLDLWDATGALPRDMAEVLWRAKQITYASRTPLNVDAAAARVQLRHAVGMMKAGGLPQAATLSGPRAPPAGQLDIVHIVYRLGPDQVPNSDAEFSRHSLAERRAAGYRDMHAAISARPWQTEARLGARVHRCERARLRTLPDPSCDPPA